LCFLTNAHEAISFPLSTNLPASPKIWYVMFSLKFYFTYFSFSLMIFLTNP
jgi:hypothetical protein